MNRRIEITALRRDGTEFPVELTVSPLKVGESYMFGAFIADITARKHAQSELQKSEEQFRDRVSRLSDRDRDHGSGLWFV